MKIALVRTASNKLRIGAYNVQEIGLAKALLKYQFSIDIYARFSNVSKRFVYTENEFSRITIVPLKGYKIFKEIVVYPSLLHDLKSGGYSWVLLEDDSQIMLPYLFKKLSSNNIKTILWQGMYRNFSNRFLFLFQKGYDFIFKRMIINNANIKLAKTHYAKIYLEDKGYTHVDILSVGLDFVERIGDDTFESVLRNFSINKSKILLYIGVVDSRRDVLFLVDLLKGLEQYKVGLIVIGDGDNHAVLQRYILKKGLQNSVLALKSVDNAKLHLVYSLSDVFLLPTRYEIFGMVILEALNYGVPVIATNEAGPKSILENEFLGKCVELDYQEWRSSILFYFSNYNSDEFRSYRNSVVLEKYNWDSVAVKFLNYIS